MHQLVFFEGPFNMFLTDPETPVIKLMFMFPTELETCSPILIPASTMELINWNPASLQNKIVDRFGKQCIHLLNK
jgi:hypothetical protein